MLSVSSSNKKKVYVCSSCCGQAAVETVFALVVLVFLILMTAQLFFLSEKAIYLMAAVHKTATDEARDKDNTFSRIQVSEQDVVQTLPGMQWALDFLRRPGVDEQFSIERNLLVFGGAYQGRGESIFVHFHRGQHPCPRGESGKRENTVREALGLSARE